MNILYLCTTLNNEAIVLEIFLQILGMVSKCFFQEIGNFKNNYFVPNPTLILQ
jgi:hypothetical protein